MRSKLLLAAAAAILVPAVQAPLAAQAAPTATAEAQDARLTAFLDAEFRAMDAMAGQRAVFDARRAALISQVAVHEARIGQQDAIIAGATGQLRA